jgi:predicted pyridoxine 5'-phosphate oxidase superfamily flavin-nucleotide-binding protein
MSSYHQGQRELQDAFDSRRIADRLEEVTYRNALSQGDREVIETADMFFLATADAEGHPDCSYKGGDPGFVRVLSETEIAWADYDGNGQFRSLGNIVVQPAIALLFINWQAPSRLRVHGSARVTLDDPMLSSFPGGRSLIRLTVERVFPNCPRYVHRMARQEASPYVPREGCEAPEPGWKRDPRFRDALPRPPGSRGGS